MGLASGVKAKNSANVPDPPIPESRVNLLGLDTSTLRGAIAILRSDGSRFAANTDPASRHGRDLVPAIRDLLAEAGLRPADLGCIGVGLGPGSYTGLRVGVTAAKTLAFATGARLVGLDSLEFFARAAPGDSPIVTVISDAQRGDFHVEDFDRIPSGTPGRRGLVRIESPAELRAAWTEPRCVTGPGLAKWTGEWPGVVTPFENPAPGPLILLDMMRDAISREEFADGPGLEPIYLRRSSAEDLWDKRR